MSEAYIVHCDKLRGRLVGLTHDVGVAEDLCQEAFTRLVIELRAGRTLDNPGAWLHRVAGNLVINRARHAQVVDRRARSLVADGSGVSAEAIAVGNESMRELRQALGRLSAGDRDLLVFAAAGATGREISTALGTRPATSRVRLMRARQRLGQELGRVA